MREEERKLASGRREFSSFETVSLYLSLARFLHRLLVLAGDVAIVEIHCNGMTPWNQNRSSGDEERKIDVRATGRNRCVLLTMIVARSNWGRSTKTTIN